MQAKFTIQYGEFAVAQYLSDNIKNASVFVPTSAQEKGIDLLLYKFCSGVNLVNSRPKIMRIGLFCLDSMHNSPLNQIHQVKQFGGKKSCLRSKTKK